MPNENNSNGPPQPNPVLTAYEGYVRDTPLLTRYILNSLLLSYLLSFFANPAYALANIPLFTIFKFELYRIFTSPLVCADILSLIFAFMGFMNHGIKLEQSVGSCMFGVLFFTLTVASNVLFLLVSVLLWGLTNSESYLVGASMGIWSVLLAIIAVECSQAPPDTKRKLFFLTVPTLYYPLVLLALFSMFAGVKLAYCLGVAVGYAYGYGKLDRLKVKVERARKWEGGCLRGFVGRMGWISVSSASGAGAWSEGGSGGNNDSGGGSGPIGAVRAPSDPAAESSTPTFPTTGGRSLGSTSSRGLLSRGSKSPKTPEERAALLERAAERRRQQQEEADSAV
ncbi:predicted protein [Thalassiosira pseudonana CCMP1335]|uniref:Peptidase S54 rhomboid domain-containing protein n=1 Tax=Thalassiosira pseudonana TaxID=35128 RepID=B8BST0_THAPS|nr:predicted protein [Thalassiosira pseudonana CCMP1335]EED95598.1 predicted protein [Thalassiosira pseudonana CCMP1335]|eukprot:g8299.t1 g8299   contig29:183039-184314(-)